VDRATQIAEQFNFHCAQGMRESMRWSGLRDRAVLFFGQMTERVEDGLRKFAQISLLLAGCACLVFWLLRVWHAVSFVTPYMIATTGSEEIALFPIWKFVQHQAVYADPHRIPFADSIYNWGFYFFYGCIARAFLHLLSLDAIWMPTIGRVVSILFTLLTGGVFYLSLTNCAGEGLRDFAKAGIFTNRRTVWAWILIVTLSPLVGFFSISVRPDIGALTFESAGLYLVLRYFDEPRIRLIILAALLFYTAWAFKQTSVTMLAGSTLSLALFRRWRACLTLSGIWWFLVLVTLIVGGPIYRESILLSQKNLPLLVHSGFGNAWIAGERNPFVLPGVAGIFFVGWRMFQLLRSRPIEATVTLTVLFSFCFTLATSSKLGASSYYYMPAAWVTMLGVALLWEQMNSRWTPVCVAACSWLLIAGIALGHTFYGADYRHTDSLHRAVAEKLSHLPGPVFVTEAYSDLPWVQRLPPNFVFGFEYEADRDAGVPFEGGGWEGLASEGYFGTLVTYRDLSFPPALLEKYQLVDEYKDANEDYKFYRRIGTGNR
jgi:hypothetical protein